MPLTVAPPDALGLYDVRQVCSFTCYAARNRLDTSNTRTSALQAYEDFIAEHDMPFALVGTKGGLLRKPNSPNSQTEE